jgi:Sec-independent protein secretion pathway component TatC
MSAHFNQPNDYNILLMNSVTIALVSFVLCTLAMAASFIIQIPLLFIHALRPMLPDIWINGNGCILMMVISSTVITALAYVLWYFFRLEQSDEIGHYMRFYALQYVFP